MSQQCGDGRCKTQQDRVLLTDSVGGRPGGQSRYTGRRKQGVVDVSVCCVCVVLCVCVVCVLLRHLNKGLPVVFITL